MWGLFFVFFLFSRKEMIAQQREYKKKKALKKAQRIKELEQEREDQKVKWQQFNNRAYSKNKKGQVCFAFVSMWVATGHRLLCSTLGERRRWFLKGCNMGIWVSLGFWSVQFCILYTSNAWFFAGLFWRSAAPKRLSLHLAGRAALTSAGVCWSQKPEGPSKPPSLASCCVYDPADTVLRMCPGTASVGQKRWRGH